VHVPLGPTRRLLAALEPWLLSVLPLTAGQLATFANDGLATRRGALPPPRVPLASMLSSFAHA
jgi:hypothetical protein